jgi:hypothetical protein
MNHSKQATSVLMCVEGEGLVLLPMVVFQSSTGTAYLKSGAREVLRVPHTLQQRRAGSIWKNIFLTQQYRLFSNYSVSDNKFGYSGLITHELIILLFGMIQVCQGFPLSLPSLVVL